jgi:TolA-binding protein
MRYRSALIVIVLTILSVPLGAAGRSDKDKDQMKAAIDDLKSEVVILERQVGDLRQSLDRNSGQMGTLITQISDNVNAIRQAQSRVADSAGGAINAVSGISEQLGSTNERINKLSGQIEELRKLVENMPKLPAFSAITPGNPEQLFAAAVADYYRANYDLALSEFRDYAASYPQSQMACYAQFWVGECLFAKQNYQDAINEYDQVGPKCDKAPGAIYKKAKALLQLGQTDAAAAELKKLAKYPNSNEAALAKQDQAPH